MEALVVGYAANVLSSVTIEVGTSLIRTLNERRDSSATKEAEKLKLDLDKARELCDNLLTPDRWQRKTADVLGVCYDIEDLVNYVMVNTGSKVSVSQWIAKIVNGSSTRKQIKELRNRLEAVTSDLDKRPRQQEQQRQGGANNNEVAVPDKLVGREKEKEEIISLLLDNTVVSVSIVGIGGLGKTTLAWHVKSDPRIQDKFNIIWVPMPGRFDLKAVAELILRRRMEDLCILERDNPVLFGARESALIVLDGLRDVTNEQWRSFSSLFLRGGCKVLVTTHNPRVASNTSTPRYLPLMSYEDCRDLVMDRARCVFGESGRPLSIMERNSETIAKMSKGLPLAASVLGHCLSCRCRQDGTLNLSNVHTSIYKMREYNEEIFPKLNLDAAGISSHLTRCLAYCSLFPRNHDFKKDSLVHLWMAEDFIVPDEMADEYFDDLHWRSFFQPSQPGGHESSSYKMHEFIHRFVELVASGIYFRWEDNDGPSKDWYEKVRHISFPCTSVNLDFEAIEKFKGLRTFLLPSEHKMLIKDIPYSFLSNLSHLRVLDLSHTQVIEIPGSLGMLLFLRYLDLSETHIKSLPASISKILRLLVLKLRGCAQLLELPKDFFTFTSIKSLVHLEVDIGRLRARPASVGRLIHLQTLPTFFVGEEEGKRITELSELNSLRGTLKLVDLENVKDEAEARKANLCEKQSLGTLELEWHRNFNDAAKAEGVFEGLEPHHNVKKLKVTHYVGSSFPAWLTTQPCTLVSIHVQDCPVHDALSGFGKLPYLEILHLEKLHRVTDMRNPIFGDRNSGAFPSLKSLAIRDMEHLTSWHELPNNCMQKLTDLTIEDCPNLSSMPSLEHISSLKTLEITRCPELEALPRLPPSVQSLIIFESDTVKQRCQPQGPDWHMIRPIPRVAIDGRVIDSVEIDDSTIDSVVGLPRFQYKFFSNLYFYLVLAFAFLVKLFWFYCTPQKH